MAERKNIDIKIFYTWGQLEHEEKFDPGFGKNVQWDIPLLNGYDYTFVRNTSKKPGSKKFKGIQNPTLIREIEVWNADAILIFGWKFRSHLQAIKYFNQRIPVLFRGDSTLLDSQSRWRTFLRKRVLKRVFKNIDFALYTGTANKRYFEMAGLKDSNLIFVPHAIDNFRFQNSNVLDVPNWPGENREMVTFLFAGKLEDKKNPELLLSAFAKQPLANARLVVVGNGPLENSLKTRFSKDNNILFLDFQNQELMPSIYKKSDVFVLPSKGPGETWGLAVNEAMACGRPVLISDKCGCAVDLVEIGKTGYVFKSDDINDLTEKLNLILQNKSKLKEMGKNAFQKIQDWSFDHIVEAIENLVMNHC